MRVLEYRRYGPPEVVTMAERPAPEAGRGQAVVRVAAWAINPKDVLERKGKFRAVTRLPRVPGYDLAGTVIAVGPGADLAIGARVFGLIGGFRGGAAAEQVAVPVGWLAPLPHVVGWTAAAATPLAALTALQALRDDARLRPGERVLVNGASGGVGTFAVQIARLLGARVTAVASGRNEALVRGLGVDDFIDYTAHDPLAARAHFDVFFDVFGNRPFRAARSTLAPGGRYVTTLPRLGTVARSLRARLGGPPARLVVVRPSRDDLGVLSRWLAVGAMEAVIDRVASWDEFDAAQRHLETRRARGKIVLTLPQG